MNRPANMPIYVGDRVKMKKPHPCGGDEWVVIRTGADIKIRCLKCSRLVMLERTDYIKRLKKVLESAEPINQQETEL